MSGLAAKADGDNAEFYKWRDQWRTAVTSAKLSGLTVRVALAVEKHINRQSGTAWPSVARLASLTGATSRGVQKSLRALEAHGLISIQLGGGRGHANLYHLTMPQAERVNISSSYVATKTVNDRDWKGRTNATEKGEQSFTQNPLKEPLKKEPTQASDFGVEEFEVVWQSLPLGARQKSSIRRFAKAYSELSDAPSLVDLERAAHNFAHSPRELTTPADWWLRELQFKDYLGPRRNTGAI